MRHARTLCLTLTLAITACAATAATAAAEVEILPNPTTAAPLNFTSKSENATNTIEGKISGSTVNCESATDVESFTSANLGTGETVFKGCLSKAANCKSAGAGEKEVVIPLDVTLVGVLLESKLFLGVAAQPLAKATKSQPYILKCGSLELEVKGSAIGQFLGLNPTGTEPKLLVLGHEALLSFVQSVGVQAVTTCDVPESFCKGKTFTLETNFGGGKGFEASGLQTTQLTAAGPPKTIHIDY